MASRPLDVPIRPSHPVAPRRAAPSSARPRTVAGATTSPGQLRTALVVGATAAAAGLLVRLAALDAPGRGRDEGVLVAAAGEVSRSLPAADTIVPAGPTLATWHLVAWDGATGAFERAPSAVAGGRELAAVALAVTVGLTWALARRLGLARWSAAPAAAAVALSPLAADLFGRVQPGALAAPWLLGALVAARTRRRLTVGPLAAGGLVAVAALTAPVAVVATPAVVWQVWRAGRPAARPRAAALAVVGAVAVGLPGWLLVLDGTTTLASDAGLASLGGALARSFGDLVAVDPLVVGVAALAAAVAPLARRRVRPLAAAFWPLAVAAWWAGVPPTVALACALPLGAVLIAAAVEAVRDWVLTARRERRVTSYRASAGVTAVDLLAPATLAAFALAGALALPRWLPVRADALAADDDGPTRDAQAWVDAHAPTGARLVVDERLWLDAVLAGRPPGDVTTLARPFADGGGYDLAVVPATGGAGGQGVTIATGPALAAFGDGAGRVEVRQAPGAPTDGAAPAAAPAIDPAVAGAALAANPRVVVDPPAAAVLRAGGVDERILSFLATVAADHRVSVAGFPLPAAEAAAGAPARIVEISAVDDLPIRAVDPAVVDVTTFLDHQTGWYRPTTVEVAAGAGGRAVLRVTYPPA